MWVDVPEANTHHWCDNYKVPDSRQRKKTQEPQIWSAESHGDHLWIISVSGASTFLPVIYFLEFESKLGLMV